MTRGPILFDYYPWAIFDKRGHPVGIRDDAPKEAKEAYEEEERIASLRFSTVIKK